MSVEFIRKAMVGSHQIGLIGLAVMGANLARNIADKGYKTIVFNRTLERTKEFIAEHGHDFLEGSDDLQRFVLALERPRKIIIMVKAGAPVDELIQQLLPYLDAGDMLVDCGNSHWPDTVRREKDLQRKGILFFGCGVSGGEEGALHGPSIMPGGDKENYEKYLAPIFESIAAKDFSGSSCVTWIGENGAGHYVKMVHNGIEYAVMQILAETYDILRQAYKLSALEIADVFLKLHTGKLKSFLTEISVRILQKKDDLAPGYLINKILDQAGQKGTGKWTVLDALERNVSIPSISAAVDARLISNRKDLRHEISGRILQIEIQNTYQGIFLIDEFIPILENAIYVSLIAIYAQGCYLIRTSFEQENWTLRASEIARIWQGGCIIRANILSKLEQALQDVKIEHIFLSSEFSKEISAFLQALRRVVSMASGYGDIAIPVLSSGLHYIEGLRQENGNANFIQGLRDFFGAHTFERTDQKGIFHADWDVHA